MYSQWSTHSNTLIQVSVSTLYSNVLLLRTLNKNWMYSSSFMLKHIGEHVSYIIHHHIYFVIIFLLTPHLTRHPWTQERLFNTISMCYSTVVFFDWCVPCIKIIKIPSGFLIISEWGCRTRHHTSLDNFIVVCMTS